MSDWPELSVERDHETLAILHLAAQMLGKIRVAHAPWTNHGWHVALQPVANGFETLPTSSGDGRAFTLRLDLWTSLSRPTRWRLDLEAERLAAHRGLKLAAVVEQ